MRGWILATVLVARAAFGDAAIPGGDAPAKGTSASPYGLPALSVDGTKIAIEVSLGEGADLIVEIHATDGSGRHLGSSRVDVNLPREAARAHVARFLRTQGVFVPLAAARHVPPAVRARFRSRAVEGASCHTDGSGPLLEFLRAPGGGLVATTQSWCSMPTRYWYVAK